MLAGKMKESLISVLPIAAIVLLLSFSMAHLSSSTLARFGIGCLFVIVGMMIFGAGADISMIPIGEAVGIGITKTRNIYSIVAISFVIGAIITIAEPDLSVLAGSLDPYINKWLLICLVAIGVGVFLAISMVRVIIGTSLQLLLVISYSVVFILSLVLTLTGKATFLPISFDSGGVTTGPMTVPFIIAMGVGVSAIGGKSSADNSFGFVALASVGPIIAVLILWLFANVNGMNIAESSISGSIDEALAKTLTSQLRDVIIALGPIVVCFIVFRLTINRNMSKSQTKRIILGLIYTYIGLVLFMTGAKFGFFVAGSELGASLSQNYKFMLVPIGMIMGFLIVAAEPAVHILNTQIEKISDGTIKKAHVLITLMCGVAISVGLAMLRLLFTFSIWWLILPGYAIAITLSFIVPKTYSAIAFDSGGVASGPMTASFLIPLAIGACTKLNGASSVMEYAYGVVAMVAMTPLIAVQILGLVVMLKKKKTSAVITAESKPVEIVELKNAEDNICATEESNSTTEKVEIIDLE